MSFKIKRNLAAGFLGDYVIIADVHFGFEEGLNAEGYSVSSKTEEILKDIFSFDKKKLIILGDLRSDYTAIKPREGGELFNALSRLSNKFDEVVITKGNHDGGLAKLSDRLSNVKLVMEFTLGNIGFLHGHALPSKELASSVKTLCFGHLHPSLVVRDKNGVLYKKDCWSLFDLKLPKNKYKESIVRYGVAFPKFNKYIGSTDEIRKTGLMKYAKLTRKLSTDMLIV